MIEVFLRSAAAWYLEYRQSYAISQAVAFSISATEFLKLWETALNVISLNQCVEEGHGLLRTMLPIATADQV